MIIPKYSDNIGIGKKNNYLPQVAQIPLPVSSNMGNGKSTSGGFCLGKSSENRPFSMATFDYGRVEGMDYNFRTCSFSFEGF